MDAQRRTTSDMPEVAHRRVVARCLYQQAARLLLAAERPLASPTMSGHRPADRLRATAARLQILAAGLDAPVLAPVPVPIGRPHPRRSA